MIVPASKTWATRPHCGLTDPELLLDMERWRKRWTVVEWRAFLGDAESAAEVNRLRHSTHTGRPLGSSDFVAGLEELTSRPLAPQKGGRPKKPSADYWQARLISVA